MARKIIATLKTHKKKTIFFSLVGAFAAKFLNDKRRINNIMHDRCVEAKRFGDMYAKPHESIRHVTVVLNPVAKGRKAKSQYEQYAAPILNCAGIKLSVIQTEAEGQARDILEIMDNTDAVVIAGGSGTIHECVTGSLRRADKKLYPIGVLPIGNKNVSAYRLHGVDLEELSLKSKSVGSVEVIASAAMAIVKETLQAFDVMKVQAKGREREVYAVDGINLGTIRDTLSISDKYWYLGSRMKPYLSLISNSMFRDWSSLTLPFNLEMKYTKPCSGCSKCVTEPAEIEELHAEEVQVQTRWWQAFVPKTRTSAIGEETVAVPEMPKIDYSTIINEDCGNWYNLDPSDSINLLIENDLKDGKIEIMAHKPDMLTKGSYVMEGVTMFQGKLPKLVEKIDCQEIQLSFKDDSDKKADESEKKKEDKSWFSIDNENYEREDLNIKLMPKLLQVYTESKN
ncbi:Acylglycerol kinase, mitochondrial [Halotydeus destructor]|nr:Acylglycerol kinase, mitochondrial [Halotydeus destructor]